jgi:hypothetical protein
MNCEALEMVLNELLTLPAETEWVESNFFICI